MDEQLYREQILDHYKHPQNFGQLDEFDLEYEDSNPFCGDEQHVWIRLDEADRVEEVAFEGKGCAISTAATSLLTEELGDQVAAERDVVVAENDVTRAEPGEELARDVRVVVAESEQMVERLRNANKPVEYFVYEDEGHGINRAENRHHFFAKAEEFLSKHLGGRFESASEPMGHSGIAK